MYEWDIAKLKEIHEKFYAEEFPFPDFFGEFMAGFVIEDANKRILLAGGVKPLAESVIITNKDMNHVSLGRALVETIDISTRICNKHHIKQLHAFIQDDVYGKHLLERGFEPVVGRPLVLSL